MPTTTTTFGVQSGIWNAITFGDILGVLIVFIGVVMIALLIDRIIITFQRSLKRRN